jgi:hypothetical protein
VVGAISELREALLSGIKTAAGAQSFDRERDRTRTRTRDFWMASGRSDDDVWLM